MDDILNIGGYEVPEIGNTDQDAELRLIALQLAVAVFSPESMPLKDIPMIADGFISYIKHGRKPEVKE